MKIPLLWLKDYLEINKPIQEVAVDFTQLGLMLDKPLDSSNVLDLEQRLNRSDLLSIIGCARDLAAFEEIKLKLPKLISKQGKSIVAKDKIQIIVETPAVSRFRTRQIKNIKVGPSPSWLVERLQSYGMDSINNIVDVTNYVMVEYGQTLHAQDIARLKGRDITIRQAKDGEKLTTLLGTEVILNQDAFVLTSGGHVTVIGGIVGGKDTGVSETTTDIILDSGHYDSRVIRKVSRGLKIINESVSRNEKFLDPRTIDLAIVRATDLILNLAGGEYYENDDYYPHPVVPQTMTLRLSRLALISGMDIPLYTVKKILKSLEYSIIEEGEGKIIVEVPYFRTDVEVEDDLVSDILRINNYNQIPLSVLSTAVPRDITPPIYRFEDHLRDLLIAQGLHEHITNSLTQSSADPNQVTLVNALTSDQNALRTALVSGLIHVLSTYKKHKITDVGIFEIGKVFRKNNSAYLEGRLLTVMGSSNSLATLFASLGITDYQITKNCQITINHQLVGTLTPQSYTLVTDQLMLFGQKYAGIISKFTHTTSLDFSLLVPADLKYADITETLSSIKVSYQKIFCKSMTKMNDKINNYLLTFTWDASSKDIQHDKGRILAVLEKELAISSKS